MSDIWDNGGVDFVRPIQTLIPGAQGRILAVLAETSAELNLRTIARLAGVSVAHASRILPTLVELGVVDRRDAPPSALFRFVPDNVAARAISALAGTRQSVLDQLTSTASQIDPAPVSVVVFGSFARGEADAESDIDVLVVRRDVVDEESVGWRSGLDTWLTHARAMAGNRIEVVEVDEAQAARSLRGRSQLWADIQRDGILVFGCPLVTLKAR